MQSSSLNLENGITLRSYEKNGRQVGYVVFDALSSTLDLLVTSNGGEFGQLLLNELIEKYNRQGDILDFTSHKGVSHEIWVEFISWLRKKRHHKYVFFHGVEPIYYRKMLSRLESEGLIENWAFEGNIFSFKISMPI